MKNSKGIEFLMKKNKCTVFKGTGKVMLPGKVEVTGEDGKPQTIQDEEHHHCDGLSGAADSGIRN